MTVPESTAISPDVRRTNPWLAVLATATVLAGPPALSAQDVEASARVVSLQARPASVTVTAGQSVPFRVVALDADGAVVDAPVRVAAPRGAAELSRSDGTLEGERPGSYEIVASLVLPPDADREPPTIRVPLTVHWPPVTEVRVTEEPGRLYVGTILTHAAEALHGDGSPRPEARIRWESSDPGVAEVDEFGDVTGRGAGDVTITASFEGTTAGVRHRVAPFPGASLEVERTAGPASARTGDVLTFQATVRDEGGRTLDDVPVTWTHTYRPVEGVRGPPAPGQLADGRFVADVPGIHTVVASAGPLSERESFQVEERDVVRPLELSGQGRQPHVRTTDFWVYEGRDGRDYALTGSKRSGGHGYVWDVTDPTNIVKTDSIQVDARSVNDVKVSPDARYATLTREGASDRRNGLVLLDLEDPAHPVVASEVVEGLTGGVHNAYPTDDHAYALSGGDKYVIIDVRDIYAPKVVGEYDHPDSRVHDVWVHDGIAYSAEWDTGVVAVDVGNGRWGGTPEDPVFITSYPVPSGRTHAVFPYRSESADRFYLFLGDEIMNRRGLAWQGPSGDRGSYRDPYDPETGMGGIPGVTSGRIQVVDFTDPENPEMVARYEVKEYGTHNMWVEDDVLYQAYYEGGLRVVDVSGELMGNLYTQGREIAVYKPFDPAGYVANSPMVWSAMPHKGYVFFSDTNSGLWAVKIQPRERPAM